MRTNKTGSFRLVLLFVGISAFSWSCFAVGQTSSSPQLPARVSVKAFGAKGDGITDDAPAIRAALAKRKNVHFPAGVYLLSSYSQVVYENVQYVLPLSSDVKVSGDNGATLRVSDGLLNAAPDPTAARGGAVFLSVNASHVRIAGLTIDMNGAHNLVPKHAVRMGFAVLNANCTDCAVDGVTVLNTPGRNAIVFGGAGHGTRNAVRNCTIRNGGTSLAENANQNDFSAIYIDSSDTIAANNKVQHDVIPFTYSAGIELHGAGDQAIENYIEKSYPAMYVESNLPIGQPLRNVSVIHNEFRDVHSAVHISGTGDFDNLRIANNTITIRRFPAGPIASVGSFGVLQPRDNSGKFTYSLVLRNSTISNNIFSEADPLPAKTGQTNFVSVSATAGLMISNNTVGPISGIPIIIVGSPYGVQRLTVAGNTFNDFGQNDSAFGHTAIYVNLSGKSKYPPKNAYDAEGVVFRGNVAVVKQPAHKSSAFYWQWDSGSIVRNVVIAPDNRWGSIAEVFSGPKGDAARDRFVQHGGNTDGQR